MQLNFALYIAIALTAGALVAWVMAVRKPATAPKSERLALMLAPLAAAWLVALLTPASDHTFYKGAIALGMLLSIIGVALAESGFLPGYVAHAHLLWTYTLYAYAFSSRTSGWPTPFVLLLLIAAGLLYYWLYPSLRELWSSAAIYGLLIFLATWQALELALQQDATSWMGWAALAGMLLITIATLLEAQGTFRPPRARPQWANAALPIFLIAQLAIAWSVWG
jgi:uncharacterized membrane protein YhhN